MKRSLTQQHRLASSVISLPRLRRVESLQRPKELLCSVPLLHSLGRICFSSFSRIGDPVPFARSNRLPRTRTSSAYSLRCQSTIISGSGSTTTTTSLPPMEDHEVLHNVDAQRRILQRRKTKADIAFYFSSKARQESVETHSELNLERLPAGEVTCLWIKIVEDAFGSAVSVPVMVAKGNHSGPVFGLTAALHGNEVSGIPIIQKIFHDLAPYVTELRGTIVAVVCVNKFGFETSSRFYQDGSDLNRAFPGNATGPRSSQFAHHFFEKIVGHFNYLIDLHTASFGRLNSFYVRAAMNDPVIAKMAKLIRPTAIVHNVGRGGDGGSGTLRAAAMARGIKALCIEIGDPLVFQTNLIVNTYMGIARVIDDLDMLNIPEVRENDRRPDPMICQRSYWIHTDRGGILVVTPEVGQRVKKGDFIGSVVDIFGFILREFEAPEAGVVIGKSSNPSNRQGDRVLHLGVICEEDQIRPDGTIKDKLQTTDSEKA